MFCPKCGQQQVSVEARFCTRCGFQLGVVKTLLAADDSVETRPPTGGIRATARSLRKRDLSFGAMLMFFFALAVAAATVEMPPSHSAPIIALVVAWLLLTVLINVGPLVRYFFGGNDSHAEGVTYVSNHAPGLTAEIDLAAGRGAASLPPARSIPASILAGTRADTAEAIHPPSVTEQTTNLLDNK